MVRLCLGCSSWNDCLVLYFLLWLHLCLGSVSAAFHPLSPAFFSFSFLHLPSSLSPWSYHSPLSSSVPLSELPSCCVACEPFGAGEVLLSDPFLQKRSRHTPNCNWSPADHWQSVDTVKCLSLSSPGSRVSDNSYRQQADTSQYNEKLKGFVVVFPHIVYFCIASIVTSCPDHAALKNKAMLFNLSSRNRWWVFYSAFLLASVIP